MSSCARARLLEGDCGPYAASVEGSERRSREALTIRSRPLPATSSSASGLAF